MDKAHFIQVLSNMKVRDGNEFCLLLMGEYGTPYVMDVVKNVRKDSSGLELR